MILAHLGSVSRANSASEGNRTRSATWRGWKAIVLDQDRERVERAFLVSPCLFP
jgi:hypothetical protein